MNSKTCSIDGCSGTVNARGWCGSHYMAWYNHGDPLHVETVIAIENIPGEQWRPVVGYEGLYEVSDHGRVRSFYPPKRGALRIMASKAARYPQLTLRDSRGKCVRQRVHVLVLEAFVGPRPPGHVACHANDDPQDNRLANLRWDTQGANLLDSVTNGGHPWSGKTHCPRGHEYSADNVLWRRRGDGRRFRQCRVCERERSRRRNAGRDTP